MMQLSVEERRSILGARFEKWEPRSLHDAFDRAVDEFAERPMVITSRRSLTYREVANESRRIADGLAHLGVAAGDRVALIMANYADYVPLKVAVSRLGAVAVPLNYLYRAEELSYVLRQSRSKVLVTMAGFGGLDHMTILDEVEPGWERGPQNNLPDLERVVVFSNDGRTRDGVLTLEDLIGLGAEHAGAAPDVAVSGSDVSDLVYTSGTTGAPKGVLETHDAMLRCSYGSALTRAFEDGRRILFALPLYHMFAYVEGFLACMWVGGAVIPQVEFSPSAYLEGIEEHGASEILAVPTMTIAVLDEAGRNTYELSSLNAILSAAAPAPPWVWERAKEVFGQGVEITTGYGMTESAAGITMTRPEDPIEIHSGTVGHIKLAGSAGVGGTDLLADVRTFDPETGEELETGQPGEIAIKSPCVMVGFWDQPELTNAVLKDGWLHSGDLGFQREDGYWQLTGRTKELYKSGGELVMPKEVEEVLGRHPAVSQAYAIGVPDEKWGEAGCVVVVPVEGAEVSEQELVSYCKENLARFKVPKRVVFFDQESLPTTPTGKIQKFRLVPMVADQFGGAGRDVPEGVREEVPATAATR